MEQAVRETNARVTRLTLGKRIAPPIFNSLSCPHCGFQRLIDTGQATLSATFTPHMKGYTTADYYQKCKKCGMSIGIQKIK